jgi:hypothetical protein
MHRRKHYRMLHVVLLLLVVTSFSCGTSGPGNQTSIDLTPFILRARNDECSSTRNNLYVIDNKSVFWERAGNCADNSFSQTLYGEHIDQVLCMHFDSIAGPQTVYFDLKFKELFDTAVAHLDKPDLGLGFGHSVVQVSIRAVCTTNAGCLPNEYCSKAVGDCAGQGSCVARPEVCALAPVSIGDLVCGCDGQTYGNYINACDAAMQGVSIAHTGACP